VLEPADPEDARDGRQLQDQEGSVKEQESMEDESRQSRPGRDQAG
jgi:hypothetical protein